jgi:hypothetical protein
LAEQQLKLVVVLFLAIDEVLQLVKSKRLTPCKTGNWEVYVMVIHVPGKPDYKSIKIQTRCSNDIENRQVYDFSPNELSSIPDYRRDYSGAKFRNKPNPIYNCFGMTFACARTTVGPESVQMILDNDGYTEIQNAVDVLPGDVIIYYNDNGEIEHSGIVVSKPQDERTNIPWVVSKWGKYSEVCHQAYDVPYRPIAQVSYWRITR